MDGQGVKKAGAGGLAILNHMTPLDTVAGFPVRPGFYGVNGATAIPGGVNFTLHSEGATACELLLFRRTEMQPYAVLPIPAHYRIGKVWAMVVFGLDIEEFEYAYRLDGPWKPEKGLLFCKENILLDPYARAVTGQSDWGHKANKGRHYKARVVENEYDWGSWARAPIPMGDLVIYEAHVRGFTRHPSSGTGAPGTFAALREKIPYLKDLGVNCVELLPVFEFDELLDSREHDGRLLFDYWGYNSVCFFAPNTGYTAALEYNREGNELKGLIRALKENGIEVILDVVFNHTAEGNENGPIFSFKGFDNNIYYMLTPEGKYQNFSGCGNTLNCNHPTVQRMILECLRYWVINYRIDGFRFDLASILGRNEDGSPMNKPPLLQALATDPILSGVKLIAEAWDAGGLYQVGSFPAFERWAEWNGKYRDDLRSFLKGDAGYAEAVMQRIAGSPDLYNPEVRGDNASVNFITCHDGFPLYDLYSYNQKHNEENGWNNTDGGNDNRSWNCGEEGETDDPAVLALRLKLVRNAAAVLLCSRGTPMFLMGDEFCNTQFGNNNAYCQDNEISWLDWGRLQNYRDIFLFFRYMIHFRQEHRVLRHHTAACSLGFPQISFHGREPFQPDASGENRLVGVLFAGVDEEGKDDIVYLGINAHWEEARITLPPLPDGWAFRQHVNTGLANGGLPGKNGVLPAVAGGMALAPRSVVVLSAAPE